MVTALSLMAMQACPGMVISPAVRIRLSVAAKGAFHCHCPRNMWTLEGIRPYINIWYPPPKKKPTFLHFLLVCTVFLAYLGTFFFRHFLMIFEVVFTNVYKRYGSIAADLDPRSKIQDSRKNFLDPRSGSKIQDPRF